MNNFLDKFSKNRHHQQSLDDFMKHIKKLNLKSQRHLSPKPLLFMYSKPQYTQHSNYHNTNHTLDKSRSLSNRRSNSKKSNKTKKTKKKVSSILNVSDEDIKSSSIKRGNPGDLIEIYSQRLRKVQKYLHKKNSIGQYLCQKFQEMLNNIVQNMIQELNNKMTQIERTVKIRVQNEMTNKFQVKQKRTRKYVQKLQTKVEQLVEKQYYNNQIIYQLRKGCEQINIPRIDIDLLYGQIFAVQGVGGNGYSRGEQQNQDPNLSVLEQDQNYQIHSQNVNYEKIFDPEIKIQDPNEDSDQGNDNVTDRPSNSKIPFDGQRKPVIGLPLKKQSKKQKIQKISVQTRAKEKMLRNQQYLNSAKRQQQQNSSGQSARMQFRIRQKIPEIVNQKKQVQKASIHQHKQTTGQEYIHNYKLKNNKKAQQEFSLQFKSKVTEKQITKQKKIPNRFNFS